MVDYLHGVDVMHGGPLMVTEAILQLKFLAVGENANLGPPYVSKFCLRRMVNGYVAVRKQFVFVLFLGGPAPPEGRGGGGTFREIKNAPPRALGELGGGRG